MPSKYLMWLNILLSFLFFYRLVSSVMLSSKVAFYWFKRIHLTISHEAGNKNQAMRGQYWSQRINSRWQWKRYRLSFFVKSVQFLDCFKCWGFSFRQVVSLVLYLGLVNGRHLLFCGGKYMFIQPKEAIPFWYLFML